jgi:hypothetical protein
VRSGLPGVQLPLRRRHRQGWQVHRRRVLARGRRPRAHGPALRGGVRRVGVRRSLRPSRRRVRALRRLPRGRSPRRALLHVPLRRGAPRVPREEHHGRPRRVPPRPRRHRAQRRARVRGSRRRRPRPRPRRRRRNRVRPRARPRLRRVRRRARRRRPGARLRAPSRRRAGKAPNMVGGSRAERKRRRSRRRRGDGWWIRIGTRSLGLAGVFFLRRRRRVDVRSLSVAPGNVLRGDGRRLARVGPASRRTTSSRSSGWCRATSSTGSPPAARW